MILSLSVDKAMQPLIKLLILLAIAYSAMLFLVWLFGDRLIYFPNYPGRMSGDWQPEGLVVQDIWLRTADGVKLHSWWIPAEEAQFAFLVFHGNAGNIANRTALYYFLHDLAANILAVEYRGYGRSEGQPSENGLYQDAAAVWEYAVHNRGISSKRVIVFGASMGTAVAVDLAAKRDVAGIVLVAPFASSGAVARRVYPFLPGSGSVLRSKFDTAAKLTHVRAPILISRCHRGIPRHHPFPAKVKDLSSSTLTRRFSCVSLGSCHEDALLMTPAAYRAQLLSFLKQIEADN